MKTGQNFQIRIPKLPDIELAIKMYYENIEIFTRDIKKLFNIGANKAIELKKIAVQKQTEEEGVFWNASAVNTEVAFRAWGLDIKDLERRFEKLKKLKGGN